MIRRAMTIVREDGVLALGFRLLGATVYRRVLLLGTDVARVPHAPDARCRWLASGDAAAYARCHPVLPEGEIRQRLADGHRCLVLWSSAHEIASGMWVAFGHAHIDYLEMDLPLATGEAYLFQSYTAPAHRGRGYSTTLLLALRDALQQEGFTRTVGCIQPDRAIAYAPLYRGATVPVGYLGWIGIGPWRHTIRRVTDRFPWYAPPRIRPAAATAETT
jgi:GNAT superfamily N-acetyltransferase